MNSHEKELESYLKTALIWIDTHFRVDTSGCMRNKDYFVKLAKAVLKHK